MEAVKTKKAHLKHHGMAKVMKDMKAVKTKKANLKHHGRDESHEGHVHFDLELDLKQETNGMRAELNGRLGEEAFNKAKIHITGPVSTHRALDFFQKTLAWFNTK